MSALSFRDEVLQARRGSWLGGISLLQPLRLWMLAAVAIALALTVIAFLLFGEYSRRSRVAGELVPDLGLATVVAPVSGVMLRSFPQEGDRVAAGGALSLIQIPRVTGSGTDANAASGAGIAERRDSLRRMDRAMAAQSEVQRGGLSRQIGELRHELAQIEAEIRTRTEQVRIARETAGRYRLVLEQKYVSELQLKQQEQTVLELLSQQQAMQRQATGLRRNLAQLEQGLAELPTQRMQQRADNQRQLAQLEQDRVQQEANGEMMVNAPLAGLVASRLVEPGQAVQAGQPLLNLLPAGARLQAQLLVPSSAIGFIAPGNAVLLRYRAFPYQKFGQHRGRVVRISRSAMAPREGDAGAASSGEAMYRVIVALDRQSILAYGKPEALRPGMAIEADILGERRRLFEWLLEPLYSLDGRMGR
ncbi:MULTISPECIES: HlyD family efflux transporter periplasmic adaptor subunit [unclassified Lysobacter]|uniref:HlyD family secretion protein n=1 Tax=unclassified Lysobacter TaxID=2635362 RepID=UPI001BE5A416|nr:MULTISPECIES: HlyD family efflux transporter periplasmic adaptor subunit [unclassified Lysobacter]MBT2750231.1 HlyD family efflux transporter periplasmic adaptor subunit [Lysobacter sp. ISL-50]MBT2775198.1 HlyD family efflux transporter periplasmic adaptor subunit [Lysobacter sp. ISL-54]MBT2782571.1 HlyD family efflux transporter periplasmic adaptor subunit [Lysobacter sp. ISL-52]